MSDIPEDVLVAFKARPLSSLDLSVRARRCLDLGGFVTIGDLMFARDYELLRVPGFGSKTVKEVRGAASAALFLISQPVAQDTAPDANGWMPIETAPHDQTAILGCHINSKIMHVTWRFSVGNDHYVRFGEADGRSWRPTHWQPLPKPPVPTPELTVRAEQ